MHCPNCGNDAPDDQRFCRSCGLGLDEFSRLLAEKLPAANLESSAGSRAMERVGIALWIVAGVILVGAIFWTTISEVIIAKGEILSGILFLTFILALVLGGLLVSYSSSRKRPSGPDGHEKRADTTPELQAGISPSLRTSVTERTTELIESEQRESGPTRSKDSSA